MAGQIEAHISAHLVDRRAAMRRQIAKRSLPFRPGVEGMSVKSRSGRERRPDAVARQNQREAKLVLAMDFGCMGLRRD